MIEKMKPCPFCGEIPEVKNYGELYYIVHHCTQQEDRKAHATIEVEAYGGEQRIIKEWNRRYPHEDQEA